MINYKYANFSHGRFYVCVSIHLLHSALLIPVVRSRTLKPFRLGTLLFPSNTDFSLEGRKVLGFFFCVFCFCFIFCFLSRPPLPSIALSVARIQRCKSMHHFSPACRFDIDKSGQQPLRLFAGLNFTDVRLLSFPRLNAAQQGWICKTNAAVCV